MKGYGHKKKLKTKHKWLSFPGGLSAGRGHTAQDSRDTGCPCRTDAALCVPVGPGESLRRETVQPQGGNTFCWGVGGLADAAARGVGIYRNFLQGTDGIVYGQPGNSPTQNRGLVRAIFVSHYATASPQLTNGFNFEYFWQVSVSCYGMVIYNHVCFSQGVISGQTDHVAWGHSTGQSTWVSNRPLRRPSIIDAMLLTHGRWQHNTSQVRWIFHIKAVQSQRTFLFEVWGMDDGEIGTCVELFTITPAIWKLE